MAHKANNGYDTKYCDVHPTEVKKGEQLVTKAKDAIENFLNPFTVEIRGQLMIIFSGVAASAEIASDVLNSELLGEHTHDEFIEK